jgi:hypothetical protein
MGGWFLIADDFLFVRIRMGRIYRMARIKALRNEGDLF